MGNGHGEVADNTTPCWPGASPTRSAEDLEDREDLEDLDSSASAVVPHMSNVGGHKTPSRTSRCMSTTAMDRIKWHRRIVTSAGGIEQHSTVPMYFTPPHRTMAETQPDSRCCLEGNEVMGRGLLCYR